MTVRAATVSDAAAIAALEAAVFPDAWGEQTIADTLRSERTHAFVALDGASVTGFVLAQSIPPEAELLRIGNSTLHWRFTISGPQGICAVLHSTSARRSADLTAAAPYTEDERARLADLLISPSTSADIQEK